MPCMICFRRTKTMQFPLRIARAIKIRVSQSVMKLTSTLQEHHQWTYFGYSFVLVGLSLGWFADPISKSLHHWLPSFQTPPDRIANFLEKIGHVLTISVAATGMVGSLILFAIRRSFDPLPRGAESGQPTLSPKVHLNSVIPDREAFQAVVEFGEEAFAAWGGTLDERRVVYEKFVTTNPDSLKLISYRTGARDDQIGFSCVLPITEGAFQKYRLGKLDSWEFAKDDIVPSGASSFLCLNAIFVCSPYRKKPDVRGVQILCRHVACFLPRKAEPMPVPLFLVAEGLTTEGRRFLKRHGFESFYINKDHNPIFQLDLSREALLNDRAAQFRRYLLASRPI